MNKAAQQKKAARKHRCFRRLSSSGMGGALFGGVMGAALGPAGAVTGLVIGGIVGEIVERRSETERPVESESQA